jgi:hypothetical protein
VHFLVAALASFLSYWFLRLAAWSVACILSLIFLKKNLWEEIANFAGGNKALVVGIVACGHLLIVVSTNLYFLASK